MLISNGHITIDSSLKLPNRVKYIVKCLNVSFTAT